MASSQNVNAVIDSLLATFRYALDVVGNVSDRKVKKTKHLLMVKEEEQRLTRSLQKSNNDVKAEYDKNWGRFGDIFAIGDGRVCTLCLV
jgi:hypothetical protein